MFSLSLIVIRVFTYFILGLPLDRKCVWRASLTRNTRSQNHGTDWRKGPTSTMPRGLERGRNGRVQSTLRDCRPINGLLTRMQPSERSPKWRPVLAKGVQRTTTISGSPSVDSFNKDSQILPHFCLPYAVRVGQGFGDSLCRIFGLYPWQCTLCLRCFHRHKR